MFFYYTKKFSGGLPPPPPVNFDRFDPKPGESRPQAKTVTVEVREEQADSQKSVGSPLTRLTINTYVQYLG